MQKNTKLCLQDSLKEAELLKSRSSQIAHSENDFG